MNSFSDAAILNAGFGDMLALRRTRPLGHADIARLRAADLLILGAMADRVRAEEVGPEVFIYVGASTQAHEDTTLVLLPRETEDLTGLDLLREVATARIGGPVKARVRVDWGRCGLELAQVALGFGANELTGELTSKRGLPMAEGELLGVGKRSQRELAHVAKRKELAAFVRRAGREPIFVTANSENISADTLSERRSSASAGPASECEEAT